VASTVNAKLPLPTESELSESNLLTVTLCVETNANRSIFSDSELFFCEHEARTRDMIKTENIIHIMLVQI
jgi:hypothetical protein